MLKLISNGVHSVLFHLNNFEIKISFSVSDKFYILFVCALVLFIERRSFRHYGLLLSCLFKCAREVDKIV